MLKKLSLFGHTGKINYFITGLLVLLALYINLDVLPLIGDEAIRAVVAMEMMISGDFITPTLNGEIYLNKPPLFNWILIVFFRLFNSNSEFFVRFPTTLFLIGYCLTIYYWIGKKLGKPVGILSSLLFLTCGRILFWDSFLGLIDTLYSWLIFINFMVIYHYFEKRSYLRLFVLSYLITAACFLLKGIPSLAFQGITLLVIFISEKQYRTFFSWRHISGIFAFLVLCGTYYLFYYLRNPQYLDDALLRLVFESSDKSVIGTGIPKTLGHILTFPFEVIYHFWPWTVMAIFLFNSRILRRMIKNRFIRYCMLAFSANIIIYWLSPITYPRYLLMLMPLAFTVFLYATRMHALLKTRIYQVINVVFRLLVIAMPLLIVLLPILFAEYLPVNYLFLKVAALAILAVLILRLTVYNQIRYGLFYITVLFLLVGRIGFNLFLIPYRESQSWTNLCRSDAIKLAKASTGEKMYVMADTITMHNVYYLTRERNEILRYKHNPECGPWFITDEINDSLFIKKYTMRVPIQYKTYFAGKYKDTP